MQAMINELGLLVQGGFVLMADYVEFLKITCYISWLVGV